MSRAALAVVVLLVAAAAAPAAEPPKRDTEMDQAIDRALAFLHEHQSGDGSWRMGPARRGGAENAAVTSLAVMAFLAAGHVPGEGKYGKTVEKGVRRILDMQKPNGLIAANANNNQAMYQHGISTLMLAEVAGMTDGELGKEIRKKLEKAVHLILRAQKTPKAQVYKGGWRYHINSQDSDMSLTGWQLMALRAAKNLGCDVPAESIEQAVAYIKRSQNPREKGFCYQPHGGISVACTGTAILALELCGKKEHRGDAVTDGGGYLIRRGNLPHLGQQHFSYSIYYGSQAAFQLGDNYWRVYRPVLHEVLLKNQRSDGGWNGGHSDSFIGPNYATAMAVLALAVEYRYLPIYQRGDEPTDRPR